MSILWSFSISVAHVVTSEHDARCNTDKKKKKKKNRSVLPCCVYMSVRYPSYWPLARFPDLILLRSVPSGDLHYCVFWLCNAAASLHTGPSRSQEGACAYAWSNSLKQREKTSSGDKTSQTQQGRTRRMKRKQTNKKRWFDEWKNMAFCSEMVVALSFQTWSGLVEIPVNFTLLLSLKIISNRVNQ